MEEEGVGEPINEANSDRELETGHGVTDDAAPQQEEV